MFLADLRSKDHAFVIEFDDDTSLIIFLFVDFPPKV